MEQQDRLLTPSEAARRFNPALSPARIRALCDAGKLVVSRTESGWRLISERSVTRLIAQRAEDGR